MRKLTEIIIHCSATKPEWMAGQPIEAKRAEIKRWHVEDNGWSDIGYHYLIDRDGAVIAGRPIARDGAHVKGHNKGTIGICLLGGFGSAATDAFEENFTPDQDAALRDQVALLQKRYGPLKISGHNDYAAKACPGFKVARWYDRKPPVRASVTQSKTLQASQVAKVAATAAPVAAAVADVPWQTIAVLGGLALVVLLATGVIDLERLRKWRAGDR